MSSKNGVLSELRRNDVCTCSGPTRSGWRLLRLGPFIKSREL